LIVYFNGRFIPKEDAKLSLDDRGFLFADGAYEVIRSYGGRLFKAQKHFRRLKHSLQELQIAAPDVESLADTAARLLQHNNLAGVDAVLYFQVTRGVAPRKHAFPDEETLPTVYVSVSPFQVPRHRFEHGVKAILVPDIRWARCDIKSVALLPNVLASQQAKERGAEEAVFVRDGVVTEGSHTNVCGVFEGTLVTHPRTNHILAGITREIVLGLCSELGIPLRETAIQERQVTEANELLIVGTTTEITPVVQVDDWSVGDGKPGPITTRLQRAFRELVTV
jgi:D-alanine transaminase